MSKKNVIFNISAENAVTAKRSSNYDELDFYDSPVHGIVAYIGKVKSIEVLNTGETEVKTASCAFRYDKAIPEMQVGSVIKIYCGKMAVDLIDPTKND